MATMGLKLRFTKPLILLILSEIIIIELIILFIFGIAPTSASTRDSGSNWEELMIIVFKKEYFFGKIRVTVKPYENSIVTLEFSYGKVLNITDEYVFVETLLPGVTRFPFAGISYHLGPENCCSIVEEYSNPYYVYECPKSELGEDGFLRPSFLPYRVVNTMEPYYVAMIRGRFKIKIDVYGVVPWNKS